MHIREATILDRDEVHDVYWSAFSESERALVSKLAVNLLSDQTAIQNISLVAEFEGNVVGHVAFSPVTIESNEEFQGFILAPLGVKPGHQGQYVGSKLIENGLQQISEIRADIVFVYGDPAYYGKFGFSVEAAGRYTPPYKLQYPFGWQCLALNERRVEESSVKITCVTALSDQELW